MSFMKGTLLLICMFLGALYLEVKAQDTNYYFPGPQSRFLQTHQQTSNVFDTSEDLRPYHDSQPGFLPVVQPYYSSDLQTSDLPIHLQQTLPQYRFSGLSLTTSEPSGFRLQSDNVFQPSSPQFSRPRNLHENIIPSTHRPNYSHLFPKPLHHIPSRTEALLGEPALDNSADTIADYTSNNNKPASNFRQTVDLTYNRNRSQPSLFPKWSLNKNLNPDKPNQSVTKNTGNAISSGKNTRSNFSNQRPRIFASNDQKTYKPKPLVKDYFVNNNGDVYITTKNSFSPKPTSTTPLPTSTLRKNPFRPFQKYTTESTFVNITPRPSLIAKNVLNSVQPSIDSKSSITHPTDSKERTQGLQQVIKPVTVPPDQLFTAPYEEYDDEEDYYLASVESTTPSADYQKNIEPVTEKSENQQTNSTEIIEEEDTAEKGTTFNEPYTAEKGTTFNEPDVTTEADYYTEADASNTTMTLTTVKSVENTNDTELNTEEYIEYYEYEELDENSSKEELDDSIYDSRKDDDFQEIHNSNQSRGHSEATKYHSKVNETFSESPLYKTEIVVNNSSNYTMPQVDDYTTTESNDFTTSETTIFISTTSDSIARNISSVTLSPVTSMVDDISTDLTEFEENTASLPVTSSTSEPNISKEDVSIRKETAELSQSVEEDSYNDNSVQSYDSLEYEDEGGREITDSNEIVNMNFEDKLPTNKTYDVVTMKPVKTVKEDNFKEFMDSVDIDSTDDSLLTTNSNEESQLNVQVANMDDKRSNGKKVVSVVSIVTSRSVVNNTVIVDPVTPLPSTTEEVGLPSNKEENSTDSWIIIASVQTSRSVSGARYLPSGIVEQEEKTTLVSDINKDKKLNESAEEKSEEIQTTISQPEKPKTSTESLIDKLDRVQSDLSNKYLIQDFNNNNGNNYIITEGKEEEDEEVVALAVKPTTTTTTSTMRTTLLPVKIKKFQSVRPSTTPRPRKLPESLRNKIFQRVPTPPVDLPQSDQPAKETNKSRDLSSLTSKVAVQDVSAFLPPGYKASKEQPTDTSRLLEELLSKVKIEDPSALLPPGYKEKISKDNVSALLPPGYKLPVEQSHIGSLLPPDYKPSVEEEVEAKSFITEKPKQINDSLSNARPIDISAFLPKDYKKPSTTEKPKLNQLFNNASPVDISAFLPKGFKPNRGSSSTSVPDIMPNKTESNNVTSEKTNNTRIANSPEGKQNKTKSLATLFEEAEPEDLSKFLPPGFKSGFTAPKSKTTKATTLPPETTSTQSSSTPSSGSNYKLVFPSRPGQNRKATRLTTPKSTYQNEGPVAVVPAIKPWSTRATTEFTGWPTPSTTPISIEKLLEAARTASTTTASVTTTVTTSTTTTTTTTTTTPKPTTPGICSDECDLVGTIKLISGTTWVPEYLDRNTDEWQSLANEVQSELERVFSKSTILNKWYKKIRIDGFSEGSVLVDYLVELNDVGRQVTTIEMKRIFHDSLNEVFKSSNREPKSSDLGDGRVQEKTFNLGNFTVDPLYTDFQVLPHSSPTVGYAGDDILLPQWAIAVIVIGLASLLFVIIFGVTVLVNRQKHNKKKAPIPLTDEMIIELNKNHMGGVDNYGADEFYNIEDAWNDRTYETKPKKRSADSIHDNSMANLYDSWRSEWNGHYGNNGSNNYYGNNIGHSHNSYNRRRPDYDTNF